VHEHIYCEIHMTRKEQVTYVNDLLLIAIQAENLGRTETAQREFDRAIMAEEALVKLY
jgi:hypothetical protein